MDAIDCIMTRRSIRRYKKEDVPEETIKAILEAGMMAPSAHDQRPWRFILITDKAVLSAASDVYKYHGMAKDAAFAILVCGDPTVESQPGFWVQDCSAATMNILLASHARGLGAVWTGIHPRKDREEAFRKLFRIPDAIVPFALIPVGVPAEKRTADSRYDAQLVHTDHW